ncbi:hypothetical protein QE152_g36696 [Popillia japonica]|uniref:Uncharacterized protein n=1 Tax=Popillia japonica TaxID=7064 RepID=A0AAW1IBY0_POPJA
MGNKGTGEPSQDFEYFEVLNQFLSKKHNIQPVAIVSLIQGQTNEHATHVKNLKLVESARTHNVYIIVLPPHTTLFCSNNRTGKLGPYSEDKWKHGVIIKNVSAVTYLVEVEGKIMHKHANNLRAIRNPEKDDEGKVTSELPTYIPPLPDIASNVIDTHMAHDSNTEVAKDVVVCNSPKEVSDRVEKPFESNAQILESNEAVENVRRSGRTRKSPQRLDL